MKKKKRKRPSRLEAREAVGHVYHYERRRETRVRPSFVHPDYSLRGYTYTTVHTSGSSSGPKNTERVQAMRSSWVNYRTARLEGPRQYMRKIFFSLFVFEFLFLKWHKDLHVPRILCSGVLQQNLSNEK